MFYCRLSKLLFGNPAQFSQKTTVKHEDVDDIPQAWLDEDDNLFKTNKVTNSKSKDLYANTLKQKYVTLMGTPSWAKLNNKLKTEDDDDDDNGEEVLRKVGHLQHVKNSSLAKGHLQLKNLPKINKETGNEGPIINCIEFHPSSNVALVAGQSGTVSLFSVGGDTNNKLHSFHFKKFSVAAAHFSPDGNEAYISSKEDHKYCVYDLVKAESKLVQLPKMVKNAVVFELSNNGKYLAVSDGFDELFLICVASKELLRTMKHNYNVVSVVFNVNSDKIYSLGPNGEVSVWNLSTYRVEHKFYDQGCVNASCITESSCGKLLAIGSNEGIVNIYDGSTLNTAEPTPVKSIEHLRTKITNMKFNCTTEILAILSSYYPNSVKLVHLPSYHVFPNFPQQSTNLHQLGAVSFSPNSGYMALGNNKNCAFLYRLKHFKNY